MQSPFPGMDPYLERRWSGVHARLVVYAFEQLEPQLPADLYVQVEERLIVSGDLEPARSIWPDTYVVERFSADRLREPGGVALAEPLVLRFPSEAERHTFLEIRDVEGERLVTAIEFLSATNKRAGTGRDGYLRKQEKCSGPARAW